MTQYSGVFSLQQQGQALTSGQWCTDPYYKNTTLLLHADGVANGAQNNTFLDSSTNAFTITRNGNTTQGTFSPYSSNGNGWSNYFNGSSYIYSGTNAAFSLASSAFTIEAWVFLNATDSYRPVLSTYGGTTSGWALQVYNGNLYFAASGDGFDISGTTTLATGRWYHFAVSGTGGTSMKMFIDGVQEGSTYTGNFNDSSASMFAGYLAGTYFNGYISNARIIKGTALYTSNFTPPAAPLTAVTNTSWLSCQSNYFVDNSTNAFTVSTGGSPSVQRFSPFVPQYQYTPAVIGGSGYFDGSDTLSVAANTAFVFGTGDFTIECWVYATVWNTTDIIQNLSSGNQSWSLEVGGGNIYLTGWNTNFLSGGTAPSLNAWHHIAVCRSGTTLSMFIDGTRTGTTTNSTNFSSNNDLTIGNFSSSYVNGYLSNVRLVKGTAVYNPSSSTCTVPTAPLTAVSGTSLLLNFTNAGIYDNTMMNDLETVGDAQVSTSVVKYGSGSMYFDGTGDYLKAVGNAGFNLAGDNFTIECWIYPQGSGNRRFIDYANGTASNSNFEFVLRVTSSNTISASVYSGSTEYSIASTTTYSNTWVHVAFVRSSSTLTLYLNGVSVGTSSIGTASVNTLSSAILSISSYYGGSGELYQGYIDDLRITKGVARYTANFQPPKVAFANQ